MSKQPANPRARLAGLALLSWIVVSSAVQAALSFALYVIRSWDGNILVHPISGGAIGPDVWGVKVAGGPLLLQTTFTNWLDFRQAYPGPYPGSDNAPLTGAAETNSLGYLYADRPMDAVYRLSLTFPHSA